MTASDIAAALAHLSERELCEAARNAGYYVRDATGHFTGYGVTICHPANPNEPDRYMLAINNLLYRFIKERMALDPSRIVR